MHNDHHHGQEATRGSAEYAKLGLIITVITVASIVLTARHDWNWVHFIDYFMGVFFVVFAFFKLLNLKMFIAGFASYDIVARKFTAYAAIYPFLKADFYKKTIDGVEWSIGTFSKGKKQILKAWGEKAAPHCKMHAYRDGDGWSKPIYGCPKHSPVKNGDKVVGISLRTGFFKKIRLA